MEPLDRLALLEKKLEEERIRCDHCEDGDSMGKSFSLVIREDGKLANWSCSTAKCGGTGKKQESIDPKACGGANQNSKAKPYKVITEESLELQPLCPELIAYFAGRMISGETLQRNAIMQRRHNDQMVVAFTYRRNGNLVNCKYRDLNKKFWQEKDTERILYGLDDIKQAGDVIIVEGEIDKLSMEEAGFRNCVSVPNGAPLKVSNKKLPAREKDKMCQYLWNCNDYLDKASRIILATDADPPGQALAEELARRLGKERCWRVRWPKKNESDVCKDANEVFMHLGPDGLKLVIDSAEPYPIPD